MSDKNLVDVKNKNKKNTWCIIFYHQVYNAKILFYGLTIFSILHLFPTYEIYSILFNICLLFILLMLVVDVNIEFKEKIKKLRRNQI